MSVVLRWATPTEVHESNLLRESPALRAPGRRVAMRVAYLTCTTYVDQPTRYYETTDISEFGKRVNGQNLAPTTRSTATVGHALTAATRPRVSLISVPLSLNTVTTEECLSELVRCTRARRLLRLFADALERLAPEGL